MPSKLEHPFKLNDKDFTRNRKLPLKRLITAILSLVSSSGDCVDQKLNHFFSNAQRIGLSNGTQSVHKSALTKAREKVPWQVFEKILNKAVHLVNTLWPDTSPYLWEGMSIFAIDGSKYILPATNKIRQMYDPNSGLQNEGKGHYPQARIVTAYDTLKEIPLALRMLCISGSERKAALDILKTLEPGNVILFDRGFPGYEFFVDFNRTYKGYFLMRCSTSSTFPSIENFIKSKKKDTLLYIHPSYRTKHNPERRAKYGLKSILVRAVKHKNKDGSINVFITNLTDSNQFTYNKVIKLYDKRWGIEVQYRRDKSYLNIQKFHTKSINGIKQELFAAAIMTIIARILVVFAAKEKKTTYEPQLKFAQNTLARDAAFLTAIDPILAARAFNDILNTITKVLYYKPKTPKPSQPRISKWPRNKWKCKRG
ncbi:IS4 family transposase [Pseudoalteromonas sp.]|uniref:IS4 family transposase n=1 Tax=Pseudoalteromonas sp. TaxID=53249 RepID=UPI0026067992|nr:IS4 family transposase [Pseudoalteromonas sp.]